jgi:hypothetical protein
MADKAVGEVLEALADDQLGDERQLKESLAGRSMVVIATSGTLVTLLLGGATLATQIHSPRMPQGALICVIVAFILLIAAVIMALIINVPRLQQSVDLHSLERDLSPAHWNCVDDQLAEQAYRLRLQLLADLRARNASRGRYLVAALALECIAFVVLSAAAGWILMTA